MFNLEKYEKTIMAILAVTLLVGIGVSGYKKLHLDTDIRIGRFAVDPETAAPADNESAKININTATAEEIAELKGVGKTLAGQIVDHRSRKELFLSIHDIKKVKGMGGAKFEMIKEDITVE